MKLPNISLVLLIIVTSSNGDAALINRGSGMIYDDELDITWMADAGLARSEIITGINWDNAVDWADNLVFAGYSDWRLPHMDVNNDGVITDCLAPVLEISCRDNEYKYMFKYNEIKLTSPGDFVNIGTNHYWSGTQNPVFPNLAYLTNFNTGFMGTTSKITTNRNAWAVRDGDVSVVPLPASIYLLGSGLLGVFGLASKRYVSTELNQC